MTRDEILARVRTICSDPTDDDVIMPLLDELDDDLPHAAISDLIFWNFRQLTPEQITDEAMKLEADYIAEHGSGVD